MSTYSILCFLLVWSVDCCEQKQFASLQLLDSANDDIHVHIHQIFEKFVSIISERLQAHLGDTTAYQQALIQQRQQQTEQPLECSAQMARFLKELCSLHRVLDQYLSPEQMQVCTCLSPFANDIQITFCLLVVLTGGI